MKEKNRFIPLYRGECPDLEYCDDGKAVWDMDRKTS